MLLLIYGSLHRSDLLISKEKQVTVENNNNNNLKVFMEMGWCVIIWQVPHLGIETSRIHLSMKEGSLFCFVVMRSSKPGCFRLCSQCIWKALHEEGYMGLVP
jgi:hypothetical protein